ncbi:MAG: DUF3466 family protein [Cytophagaceae bacterium]|nr:MAG: DUF3466 family protein [Cytophagaceae bacterium]
MQSSYLRLMTAGLVLSCATNQAYASIYTFFDLGALSGKDSQAAFSINNAGNIAGISFNLFVDDPVATVWNSGEARTLSPNNSWANAINSSGQVTGWAEDSDLYGKAVRWAGTTPTILPTLGGYTGEGVDINAAGHVVGFSDTTGQWDMRATIWKENTPKELIGLTKGATSGATAINNLGQIAGNSEGVGGFTYAVRWDNDASKATNLGIEGYSSYAYDINDVGQVTGYADSGVGTRATRWDGDIATDLGTLGGTYSQGYAINNSAQVVGWSFVDYKDEYIHATLWNGNTAINLNNYLSSDEKAAGWILREARGINDHGSIVGIASNPYGGQSAFLLSVVSAVPEPETYVMLLAGLSLVALRVRLKKQANCIKCIV